MITGVSGAASLGSVDLSQLKQRIFERADADGDGKITQAEFTAAGPKGPPPAGAPDSASLFAQVDGNGDGSIDRDESDAFVTRISAQMQSVLLDDQAVRSGPPPRPHGAKGGKDEEEDPIQALLASFLEAADGDGDGAISRAEVDAAGDSEATDKIFAFLDGNQDGSIDEAELAAGGEKLRQAFTRAMLALQESLSKGEPAASAAAQAGAA